MTCEGSVHAPYGGEGEADGGGGVTCGGGGDFNGAGGGAGGIESHGVLDQMR